MRPRRCTAGEAALGLVKKSKIVDKRALREAKRKPSNMQVGALCYRHSKKRGLEILLITSRRTQRWIGPKGWPMKKRSNAEAATIEAYEEAGVIGTATPRSLGFFSYNKTIRPGKTRRLSVQLFPLEVQKMRRDYAEKTQRKRKWLTPKKAAKRADPPEFAAMIRAFAKEESARAKQTCARDNKTP